MVSPVLPPLPEVAPEVTAGGVVPVIIVEVVPVDEVLVAMPPVAADTLVIVWGD